MESCTATQSIHDYSMLILKCQSLEDERHEIDCLKSTCKLFGFHPVVKEINSISDLYTELSGDRKYSFIYLSAHGDGQGFMAGEEHFQWQNMAELLCQSNVLDENCILMLSCCRGGLNEVAYALFHFCKDIQWVIGPQLNLDSCDLSVAFHVFLYNYLNKNIDPIESTKRVKKATTIRLKCFDRLETRTTLGFLKHVEDNFEDDSEALSISKIVVETVHETMIKFYQLNPGNINKEEPVEIIIQDVCNTPLN